MARIAVLGRGWRLGVAPLVLALAVIGSPLDSAAADADLDEARRARRQAEEARAEAEAEQQAAETSQEATAADQQETQRRRAQAEQDRAAAVARLDELEAAFSLAVDEYNATVEELGRLDGQVAARQRAITDLDGSVTTRRRRMEELVRSLYRGGGTLPGYEPLVGLARSPDAIRWLGLVRDTQAGQLAAIERDLADREVLADERQQLARAQAVRAETAEDLEQQRAELDERMTGQADELDELRATVTTADERLATLAGAAGEAQVRVESAQAAMRSADRRLEERTAAEDAEKARVAREQAEREQAQREQAEREQAEREQAQREQAEREQAQREQAEREQAQREQAEREQAEREQAQRDRQERERHAAQERAEHEPQPDDASDRTPARGRRRPVAGEQRAAPSASSSAASAAAEAAVQAALSQRGVDYVWGGATPAGFDCSGLTSWAYAEAGVSIPRTSREQHARLPRVARDDLRPGDLVFYNSPISHVGMYIGDGQMVEAPYTGQVVRVRPIDRSGYAGAVRPTG